MLADPPPLSGRVGVIIAGRGTQTPNAVLSLADALGWPVLADYQSGCRAPGTIRHFDALFRTPAFRAVARPEVVLTFGEPPTSEPLAEWLSGLDAELVAVVPHRQWPDHDADLLINDDKAVLSLLAAVEGPPARQVDHWRWVDAVADDAIESMLEEAAELPAPAVAREIVGGIAPGSALVIGSAAQIDDVESYGPHRDDIEVHTVAECATATALGVASTGIATTLLVDGDALSSEPTPLRRIGARDVDLTIVVVAPRSWSLPEIEAGASNGVAVHRWGQTTESQEAGPEASVRLVVAEADAHEGQQSRGRLDSAVIQAVTAALESAEG